MTGNMFKTISHAKCVTSVSEWSSAFCTVFVDWTLLLCWTV